MQKFKEWGKKELGQILLGDRMCSLNLFPARGIGILEFPLWLSGLRTRHSVCENAGLAQVKDSALPQTVMQSRGVVRIQCCCGCSISQQLQLSLTPSPELPYATGVAVEGKKKRKKKTHSAFFTGANINLHTGLCHNSAKVLILLGRVRNFFCNYTNHLGVVKRTSDWELEDLSPRPPLASCLNYHFLICKTRRIYQTGLRF